MAPSSGETRESRKRVRVLRPCVFHFTHLGPSAPLQQLIPHLIVEAIQTLHDRIVTYDRKLQLFNNGQTARYTKPTEWSGIQVSAIVPSLNSQPGALTFTRHLGVWHPRALVAFLWR
jgi:hypothetical protein